MKHDSDKIRSGRYQEQFILCKITLELSHYLGEKDTELDLL